MNQIIDDHLSDMAVNTARKVLYRFTAFSLVDPRQGTWEHLNALRDASLLHDAAALLRSQPDAVPEEMGEGEQPLETLQPSRVLARLPQSEARLNAEFEETFGVLLSKACPPYETEYIPSKYTFQRSSALADISGFYRAFGVTTSSSFPERPDHIVQELEFMALVIGMEKQALESSTTEGVDRASVCRETQARFVRDHLAWWVPAFARLLSLENREGFLAAVGDFLMALIPAERALLGVPVAADLPTPSTVEPPEACEGCQLAEES